jgi:hypothetical protein
LQPAVEPPLDRRDRDHQHPTRLGLRQPLDPHQVERLPLILRQAVDRREHAEAIGAQARGTAQWGGQVPVGELHRRGLFIQASGQVIELPAHVLAGQGEELADAGRPGLAQRLQEPLDDGREHLVGLEVQRRSGEAGVALVEQGGAELVEAADRPIQQCPNDRLGGRVAGQLVQVSLDGGGGVFPVHDNSIRSAAIVGSDSFAAGVHPPRLVS